MIRAVDGAPINVLQDLIDKYKQVDSMKDKPVCPHRVRARQVYLTLVNPKPGDRPDPPPELPKAWIGVATQPTS